MTWPARVKKLEEKVDRLRLDHGTELQGVDQALRRLARKLRRLASEVRYLSSQIVHFQGPPKGKGGQQE